MPDATLNKLGYDPEYVAQVGMLLTTTPTREVSNPFAVFCPWIEKQDHPGVMRTRTLSECQDSLNLILNTCDSLEAGFVELQGNISNDTAPDPALVEGMSLDVAELKTLLSQVRLVKIKRLPKTRKKK